MKKFNEYEFKDWLKEQVGYPIRKSFSKNRENYSISEVDEEVNRCIENLTSMELVCYLGEYLTLQE